MTNLTLIRLASMPFGVFGRIGGLATIERPWKDNAPDVSCIPAGSYLAKRYNSPKFGFELFMLEGVPNRSAIEIHPANQVSDLEGCIGIAETWGCFGGEWAIRDSTWREGFKQFMRGMRGVDEFTLIVKWWEEE